MNEVKKHAYMIMAHHRADLLQLLIDAIDDERNDIIIHIDKKSSMDPKSFKTKKAQLFFTNRICVNWAGYSQVEAEYILMKKAIEIGHHSYYHFVTGVNYPLWSQNHIHSFFNEMSGTEFIGFDQGADFSLRAKYYIPFCEHGKLAGINGIFIQSFRRICVLIQKIGRVDRRKGIPWEIKKGCAYFSITEELVLYVLKNEKAIRSAFNKIISSDEVFIQTIAYNSEFRNKIYDLNDEYNSCLREFAWPSNIPGEHPGWNFSIKDLDYLLSSKRLFAMKFESEDGVNVINKIKEVRKI